MPIATPLTALLGIKHPVMLAPMDVIAGARLTMAVSAAGGLGILGGGCSGLSYSIRFDTQPRERDRIFTYGGDVRVFIDPKSFIYLNGMVLDYEETLMRQGFNFINPNSKKSCGCGSSFSA